MDRSNSTVGENIEAIARLEEEFERTRSVPERIVDAIGGFAGSLKFVLIHVTVYSLWILINVGAIPWARRFDPFPFLLLAMTVSLEAIFLSTFVLIKQNRMSRRYEMRAHLDLQVNLLSEREMTVVLQMLEKISNRLGVAPGAEELEELRSKTSVEQLAGEVSRKLADTLPE